MRRRPPANLTLHIHAEALHGGPHPGPHDALPTLQEWERALDEDEAEWQGEHMNVAAEPTAEQEISVRGIVQGESLQEGLADNVVNPIYLDANSEPAATRRPGAPG